MMTFATTFESLRHDKRAAIIATCEPVFTAVLALIFLGENVQPVQWLGGAVILGSVIMLQLYRSKPETVPQAANP